MSTRSKQKGSALAPPLPPPTRRPGSRNTSESHPAPPVDPRATPAPPEPSPLPAPVPAPKTLKEAILLLNSHGLITKNPQLSPAIIIGSLLGVANFPKVIENGHNPILSAIALLVPEAMASANVVRADLDNFKAKFVALEEKVDKVLRLVENPMALEEDVGDKLDKMLSTLNDSASKAEAAEQAAISTQNKLTSLLEAQNQTDRRPWHRVTPKNSGSHREPAPHIAAPAPPARAAPPPLSAAKSKERATLARQRAHAQAATILIQPVPGAEGSTMDKKTGPALLKWIREAMVTTWQQLADAGHFKELGLSETPRVGFLHATRLPSGGVRFEVASLHHAALLSTVRVSKALQANLGDVECRGQRADILLASAPIEVNPEDPEFHWELERDNQLEPGSILRCSWVKPVRRRHPQQFRAVMKVSLRSQSVADELIASTGRLNGEDVEFRRIVEEPVRCLKCQRFGHRVATCKSTRDVCSQCGGEHRTSACPDRRYRFCASCQVNTHASWSRECPAFLEECRRLNEKRPENCRKYFDPERVDPPLQPRAPTPPASPTVAVAPAAQDIQVLPVRTLADIIQEDGLVPASTIPAYFPSRQKSPPPPADGTGHVSPAWSIESKDDDETERIIDVVPDSFDTTLLSSTPLIDLEAEVPPHTPTREVSPHYYLSVYQHAPPRSRSLSVSSFSSNSSTASTVTALSRQMASFPGTFDPSQ